MALFLQRKEDNLGKYIRKVLYDFDLSMIELMYRSSSASLVHPDVMTKFLSEIRMTGYFLQYSRDRLHHLNFRHSSCLGEYFLHISFSNTFRGVTSSDLKFVF